MPRAHVSVGMLPLVDVMRRSGRLTASPLLPAGLWRAGVVCSSSLHCSRGLPCFTPMRNDVCCSPPNFHQLRFTDGRPLVWVSDCLELISRNSPRQNHRANVLARVQTCMD